MKKKRILLPAVEMISHLGRFSAPQLPLNIYHHHYPSCQPLVFFILPCACAASWPAHSSLPAMDNQQRPPRSARPGQPPAYPDQQTRPTRPSSQPIDTSGRNNVSFQDTNRSDVDPQRQRTIPYAYQNQVSPDPETGGFDAAKVGRKKSLVRPDRERIEPGHRQWHYRSHLAEGTGRVGVMASSTSSIISSLSQLLI